MKCPKSCPAPCCKNIIVKVGEIKTGLMLLPREVPKLKKLARKLGVEITILPQVGHGLKGKARPRPEVISTYQMVSEPCPFLSKKNRCRIYPHRPLACRSYPFSPKLATIVDYGGIRQLIVFYGLEKSCPVAMKIHEELDKLGFKENDIIPVEVFEKFDLMDEYTSQNLIYHYKRIFHTRYFFHWYYDIDQRKWKRFPKPPTIEVSV